MASKLPKYQIIIAKVDGGEVMEHLWTDEEPQVTRKALVNGSSWGIACWDSLEEYQEDAKEESKE